MNGKPQGVSLDCCADCGKVRWDITGHCAFCGQRNTVKIEYTPRCRPLKKMTHDEVLAEARELGVRDPELRWPSDLIRIVAMRREGVTEGGLFRDGTVGQRNPNALSFEEVRVLEEAIEDNDHAAAKVIMARLLTWADEQEPMTEGDK